MAGSTGIQTNLTSKEEQIFFLLYKIIRILMASIIKNALC